MNIQEKSFINSSISENLLIFYKFVSEYNQNLINININDLNKFDLITSVDKSEKNKNLIETNISNLSGAMDSIPYACGGLYTFRTSF